MNAYRQDGRAADLSPAPAVEGAASAPRVLLLEDSPTDAELVRRALERGGLNMEWRHVADRQGFVAALADFRPDIVLSDHHLPDITGEEALVLARAAAPHVPLIEVTGTLSDEAASRLLDLGAWDFVLKDRLARLPSAVSRALREARALQALQDSEARFRALVETSRDWIWQIDADGRFLYCSPAVEQMLGLAPEAMIGRTFLSFVLPEEVERVGAVYEAWRSAKSPVDFLDVTMAGADGRRVIFESFGQPVLTDDGALTGYRGIARDITARKKAEAELQKLNRLLRTLGEGNEALVRAQREDQLLERMCQIIVERGGYPLVWVSVRDHDERRTARPIASAGDQVSFLKEAHFSWADPPRTRGLSGLALLTGEVQMCPELADDPRLEGLEEVLQRYGFRSGASFPLLDENGAFAALTLYSRQSRAFDAEELRLLEQLAEDLSYGVLALRARGEREALTERWRTGLEKTVAAIASTAEARDPFTAGHQHRVSALAAAIARELGLPADQVQGVQFAGAIHDIGKTTIPAQLLTKPGRLTDLEFKLIQTHAQASYDVLKGVEFPWPIAQAVLQHHERLDGSGYPNGLKGEAIILEARILAVADVVAAMTSHRPYRAALSLEAALDEIREGRGTLYDPAVVDACVRLFTEGRAPA